VNDEDNQLATSLARLGYDVWIGNSRGTTVSHRHVNFTEHDPEFWNFSFHEMGQYDVPANLNFITSFTKVDKVTYVGHSQGTMQFWVANMLNDHVHTMVDKFIGLAPIISMKHYNGLLPQILLNLNF